MLPTIKTDKKVQTLSLRFPSPPSIASTYLYVLFYHCVSFPNALLRHEPLAFLGKNSMFFILFVFVKAILYAGSLPSTEMSISDLLILQSPVSSGSTFSKESSKYPNQNKLHSLPLHILGAYINMLIMECTLN